ncbi:MAG: hypothetical protein QF830_07515 [Rhodospirillales bacterium]|jgi:hypothetical protein|nr:hypothetical protein [Rhodospirillales bacterium]MDP6883967.1 hypothetical protein [Rhodospirillales bacterium]
MNKLPLALVMAMLGFAVQAADTHPVKASKYAGQEKRAIKSLSPGDIAELKRGGGWGLAKAAELNGVPGPVHLLEMKDEIPLDDGQVSALSKTYERMKAQAIRQGERLIALERELESHFQNRTITDAILRATLHSIAEARKELRYIHLATHLKTPEILSPDQIKKYNALRGYDDPDPCANIPQGHDAKMWRKHNRCR